MKTANPAKLENLLQQVADQQSILHPFIIRAKKVTYVAGGTKDSSSRPSSHDLSFRDGDWTYRDSDFGDTDFLVQETVWFEDEPVWSMIYYGTITAPI
jgi:hypothetical protein